MDKQLQVIEKINSQKWITIYILKIYIHIKDVSCSEGGKTNISSEDIHILN